MSTPRKYFIHDSLSKPLIVRVCRNAMCKKEYIRLKSASEHRNMIPTDQIHISNHYNYCSSVCVHVAGLLRPAYKSGKKRKADEELTAIATEKLYCDESFEDMDDLNITITDDDIQFLVDNLDFNVQEKDDLLLTINEDEIKQLSHFDVEMNTIFTGEQNI